MDMNLSVRRLDPQDDVHDMIAFAEIQNIPFITQKIKYVEKSAE